MSFQILPGPPESGFNTLLVSRHGPMLVNRNDQYVGTSLLTYGEFSPGESELFEKLLKPGNLVVEVGANIGAHTVEIAKRVSPGGGVIAFEPQRIVFQTLCANIALNSCANVYAFQHAIGATDGHILVPSVAPDQPANFGGVSLIGVEQGERVALRTLDSYSLPACHFIKLDCEGMEVEALLGGAGTIAKYRPVLYVENDRPERQAELTQLLRDWKYTIYWHTPPLFAPENFAENPTNIFGNLVSINVLCLPAELNITVEGLKPVD